MMVSEDFCLCTNGLSQISHILETPKVEENNCKRPFALEGHLKSCLQLQTQDVNDHLCVLISDKGSSPFSDIM